MWHCFGGAKPPLEQSHTTVLDNYISCDTWMQPRHISNVPGLCQFHDFITEDEVRHLYDEYICMRA